MPKLYLFLSTTFSALLCIIFSSTSLWAQKNTEQYISIRSIQVVYENFKTVDRAFVLSHIPIREGGRFNRTLSDQSLRALYKTGYFEFVDLRVVEIDGGIEVRVHLTAKYRLKQIQFTGNERFSADRLLEVGELDGLNILDDYSIDLAREKMSDLYLEKGFTGSQVDYAIERDATSGEASVRFEIFESPKIALKSISYKGVRSIKPRVLNRLLKTKKKDLFSWLSGTGKFDQSLFLDDLNTIRLFYQNAGFLDVEVNPEQVEYNFEKHKRSKIIIHVDEGEQYFLGNVAIEGATIFTDQELLSLLKLREGIPYSQEGMDRFAQRIRDFYTARGYLETRVFADKKSNLNNRQIDVVFKVKESQKYYLESVTIDGNTKSKQRVIIRELALKPGDVFDYKRMEASEMRLKNTNYFDSVRLRPESTNIPGRKNLNILVSESRTGSFSFGAGFGSVRSSQFFLEMKQSNFDINHWQSGFQGDGQKFRARVSVGNLSSQVLFSFEEPWLFEQRIAFGANVYSTKSEYNSADYNEQRTGIELYIRRRLFELVEAKIAYTQELVDIFDVYFTDDYLTQSDGTADVFQNSVGEENVSKLGLTLLRDNRDRLLFTRNGNRSSLQTEFAGLGGDVNYFKLDLRTAHFLPTIDLWEQSVSFIGRIGSIIPLEEDDEAPFYDRFFLGGPETLRGYDYRDIGPRSTDGLSDPADLNSAPIYSNESAGGHTYGLLSVEYLFHVAEAFGFVFFYDGGFVNERESDFTLDNYADNYGFGARILMMGSPLKLDYGIPLNHPNHLSDTPQFHFSFGTRY
ncbi:MAG: outer membrane protein assembly factor BamA [Puniceicoccaceae bacterium]|nr:outer membrane protein assembly factor BamA [Puniceicoccaceae bacterium]RCL30522.1 MAG: outer membrane protein assembly factor BamA [Puniceicoccaceae bacterium]|tara:strand:- start:800 stop:3199 length:2400 start_codon:yes stop_codon:yes gene_type:complete